MVILSILGIAIGPNTDAYDQILFLAQTNLPSGAYGVVESTLIQLNRSTTARIIGFVILLIAASQFFAALKLSLIKALLSRN